MKGAARKIVLPHFAVTELSSENDEGAIAGRRGDRPPLRAKE